MRSEMSTPTQCGNDWKSNNTNDWVQPTSPATESHWESLRMSKLDFDIHDTSTNLPRVNNRHWYIRSYYNGHKSNTTLTNDIIWFFIQSHECYWWPCQYKVLLVEVSTFSFYFILFTCFVRERGRERLQLKLRIVSIKLKAVKDYLSTRKLHYPGH